jgi:histidinol dehydrogenase
MPIHIRKLPIIRFGSASGKQFMRKLNDARQLRDAEVAEKMSAIIDAVRKEGDKALLRFTKMFDKTRLTPAGLKLAAPYVSAFARSEAFVHYALSIDRRR